LNQWFRFYREVVHDPKVQLLDPLLFKFWINCLCLACENDGYLPSTTAVSFAFHLPESSVSEFTEMLVTSGLIEKKRGSFYVHNWHKRQYKSDTSTERVRAFRKRFGNVTQTVTETVPEADTEQTQKQIQNRTEAEGDLRTAYGEFKRVLLTPEQHAKLEAKLNGNLETFIDRFDRWVNEAPNAKASGVRRKDRHAYESILAWFDRDVKDGTLKPPKLSFEQRAAQGKIEMERIRNGR